MLKIALVGDYSEERIAHRAIPVALRGAAEALGVSLRWDWLHTSVLPTAGAAPLLGYHGIWCVPGSPYANMEGALRAIAFARTMRRPFIGTCAGFQHALVEYARNVWGLAGAHAEYQPDAADPLIAPLTCPLLQVAEAIVLEPSSRLRQIYGSDQVSEEYQCALGLHPAYAKRLEGGALRVAARDLAGDVRAVELEGHPFFIASLFQFERTALKGRTPAAVKSFVAACATAEANSA